MNPVRVKICGIKDLETAVFATEKGADSLGFIFYEKSSRNISVNNAREIIRELPPFVNKTGVFVDKPINEIVEIVRETGIDTIQLHGDADFYRPEKVWELREKTYLPILYAVRITELNEDSVRKIMDIEDLNRIVNAFLLDRYDEKEYGGTGKTINFSEIQDSKVLFFIHRRVVLAGGINPGNVKSILQSVMPYGIDVSSGVEKEKGVKDLALIEKLLQETRL